MKQRAIIAGNIELYSKETHANEGADPRNIVFCSGFRRRAGRDFNGNGPLKSQADKVR
jgi:hypothetical protein